MVISLDLLNSETPLWSDPTTEVPLNLLPSTSYNDDSLQPSQPKDPTLARSYNGGSLQQGFPQLAQPKDPTLVRSYNRSSLSLLNPKTPL